jgi:uncharacterized repeat protein (TIGR03803 family)
MLYGNASSGGTYSWGTLFQLSTNGGGFSVLFNSSQGSVADGPYTLAGGFLYGTNPYQNDGMLFKVQTNGSAFTNYCALPGGSNFLPPPGLLLAGNTFYGVTISGGTSNMGTVFQVNVDGSGCTVLKECTGADGNGPNGGLVLWGNTLYGTTGSGGPLGLGVVYRIDLPPVLSATPSGNTLALSWQGGEGLTCQLQYSTNLTQGAWDDLGSPIIMSTSSVTVFDSTGPGSRRFYRVRMY